MSIIFGLEQAYQDSGNPRLGWGTRIASGIALASGIVGAAAATIVTGGLALEASAVVATASGAKVITSAGLLAIAVAGCGDNISAPLPPTDGGTTRSDGETSNLDLETQNGFLRVVGGKVVNQSNAPVMLRGFWLQNDFGQLKPRLADWVLKEPDFKFIKSNGLNVVRHALHFGWFFDDKNPSQFNEQGFKGLEKVLNWAENNNVYVILDLHSAPGGLQESCSGKALWTDQETQKKYITLWQEIAKRYKDKYIIAGYDLLNEPCPPKDSDWQLLAQKVAMAIRIEDKNHILIVANTFTTTSQGGSALLYQPFTINDPNVMYTTHFAGPGELTQQGMFFFDHPQGVNYPSTVVDWSKEFLFIDGYYNNPGLCQDSDWKKLEGNWIGFSKISIPGKTRFGQVFFQSTKEKGVVSLDNVSLEKRLCKNGQCGSAIPMSLSNTDFNLPPAIKFYEDWIGKNYPKDHLYYAPYWESSDTSKIKVDQGAVVLNGCSDCKISARLLNNYFIIEDDAQYRLSGWVKGIGLGAPSGCDGNWNALMINTFTGETVKWDQAFMQNTLNIYITFVKKNQVPFYIGEWGIVANVPNGQALDYGQDVKAILDSAGFHWTYASYRSVGVKDVGGQVVTADYNNLYQDHFWSGMIDVLKY